MPNPKCPHCESEKIQIVSFRKGPNLAGTAIGIECEECGLIQTVSDSRLIQAARLTYEDEESNNEGNS